MIKKILIIALLITSIASTVLAAAAERFDVDLQNVPLKESLISLGYRADTNIIINGDLQGSVFLNVKDKTIYEILDLLALTHGFSYTSKDGCILISTENKMGEIRAYKVSYTNLEYVKGQLSLMLPKDKIYVNPEDSTITVEANSNNQLKAANYIRTLDIPVKQIRVRANFIEINRDKDIEFGAKFQTGSYTKGQNGLLYTIIPSHTEVKSLGKLISGPQEITHNGHESKVLIGESVPVFTSNSTASSENATVNVEYKDVGVVLKFTPRINDFEKGLITLELAPEVSTITKWITSGNNTAPQIATRKLNSKVRIKSGQTLVIAGLLREEDIKTMQAIPLFNKIPILGNLFKNTRSQKNRTEVLIAITPEIIDDDFATPLINNDLLSAKEELAKLTKEAALAKQSLIEKEKSITALKTELKDVQVLKTKTAQTLEEKVAMEKKLAAKEAEVKKLEEKEAKLTENMKEVEDALNEYIKKEYTSILAEGE